MNSRRLFLDTVFIQALLNRNDDCHAVAKALLPELREAEAVWTTEAVLTEVGNALSVSHRNEAVRFIDRCYETPNIHVAPVDSVLFHEALALYRKFSDKEWGLTDCISFVVMREQGLTDAMTVDRHFVQAGFRALMREA